MVDQFIHGDTSQTGYSLMKCISVQLKQMVSFFQVIMNKQEQLESYRKATVGSTNNKLFIY